MISKLMSYVEREIDDVCKKSEKDMTLGDAQALYYLTEIHKNLKKMIPTATEEYMMNYIPMNVENAKKWVSKMKNTDGTTGAHWTMEQTNSVKNKEGLADLSDGLFYAVLNMMYSDYSAVAKKFNVNTVEFYTEMAKAWIMDSDAKNEKTSLYYQYVVE